MCDAAKKIQRTNLQKAMTKMKEHLCLHLERHLLASRLFNDIRAPSK
jgi:hypothetical protein